MTNNVLDYLLNEAKEDIEDITTDDTELSSNSEESSMQDTNNPEEETIDTDSTDIIDDENGPPDNQLENRLFLFERFKVLRSGYSTLYNAFSTIRTLDLSSSALQTANLILVKITQNKDTLDELMSDSEKFLSKSYGDLLTILNIYISDLRNMEKNLSSFASLNKISTLKKKSNIK